MLTWSEERLTRSLANLGSKGRIIFSATCASRLGTTASCLRKTHADRVEAVLSALAMVWAGAEGKFISKGEYKRVRDRLDALMPDQDELSNDSSIGLIDDALAATAYSIEVMLSDEENNAKWAAQRCYDAVDRYLGRNISKFTPEKEREIQNDPLLQQELARQDRDLNMLMSLSDSNFAEIVAILKVRAATEWVIPEEAAKQAYC